MLYQLLSTNVRVLAGRPRVLDIGFGVGVLAFGRPKIVEKATPK
jgi:hypothetical protein